MKAIYHEFRGGKGLLCGETSHECGTSFTTTIFVVFGAPAVLADVCVSRLIDDGNKMTTVAHTDDIFE